MAITHGTATGADERLIVALDVADAHTGLALASRSPESPGLSALYRHASAAGARAVTSMSNSGSFLSGLATSLALTKSPPPSR